GSVHGGGRYTLMRRVSPSAFESMVNVSPMVNGAAWAPRAPSPCANAVADSSARIHPCVHLTVVTPRGSHLALCAFLLIASPLMDPDDHVCLDGADVRSRVKANMVASLSRP